MKFCLIIFFTVFSNLLMAQRTIILLNGEWEIEDSILPGNMPRDFGHRVRVPGMVNQSAPEFKDVDEFDGLDYLQNNFVRNMVKKVNIDTVRVGIPHQERNYFWYRRTFEYKEDQELVVLKINKAQFGTKVWVNGKEAGTHLGCFTSGKFNITGLVRKGENELIVRIGAHPGALPQWAPSGSDYEKPKWTPGIYDDVSITATNYPYVSSVQIAPDIHTSSITVQSKIVHKGEAVSLALNYMISGANIATPNIEEEGKLYSLNDGDTIIITDTVQIPDAELWSPEEPNLYVLNVNTGSDHVSTRFGMREFKFDTKTKLAYLNGKPYFLRGSNITLHRFFDDDNCASLPWDENWVRRLLVAWPRTFQWNAFRFCIGPVPDKWLDIADETGLIIQNEFFIWQYHSNWDSLELKKQVIEWMEDNWNHASVGWWDICNETDTEYLRGIIREVRHLDLSDRAWDNGYGLPVGPDDPVEDHHYNIAWDGWTYTEYDRNVAAKTTNSPHPTAHACVLNEYGWLWLNRDGSPTILSQRVYDSIAPEATNEQRIEMAAYLLGLETEYFRAHRNYAGVLHFTFLTGNFENVITGDLFSDIRTLNIHPAYEKYFVQVFKPLGLYINYSRPAEKPGTEITVRVMMVNDEYKDLRGDLELMIKSENGNILEYKSSGFQIKSLGAMTYSYGITTPGNPGSYWLEAKSLCTDGRDTTISRRKLIVEQ
jgi:beta-galactosidase